MQNIKCFELKYGRSRISINLDQENILDLLSGNKLRSLKDPADTMRTVLKNPIGSPGIRDIIDPGDKIAIVVSDRTRNSGSKHIVPVLIDELGSIGIPHDDISVIIACGTHRNHTQEEHAKLVGKETLKRVKVYDHNCEKESDLVSMGTTSRGTKVKLNKRAVQADKVILTGTITYHYFAGYGGGRKSILPGISSFEAIQSNHKLLIHDGKIDPRCGTGKLKNNPIHEDMIEAAKMLAPAFLINTIVADDGKIAAIFAGNFIAAHEAGCEFLDVNFKREIKKKADIVVAASGGGGKDINFIQSHKAMENASYALKDGGIMVLIAESKEGLPSREYKKWIELGSSDAILKGLLKNFTIPGHTIHSAFKKAEKFRIIWVSKLDKKMLSDMGIIAEDNIVGALNKAYELAGDNRTAYIMPEAYNTFPYMT